MKDSRSLYDYKYFHASKDFQLKPERVKKLVAKIIEYLPRSFLDVGCGLGSVVIELMREVPGVNAVGIDFAPVLKDIWGKRDCFEIADARDIPFPNKSFDLVFSSDFFEHIDEEDIDKVASEMKRVGNNVCVFVADDRGKPLNRRQRELHVTHKPLDWWKKKLKGIDVYSSHSVV